MTNDLEQNSEATNKFIDDQNTKFKSFLKFNPQIEQDLTTNYNYERFSVYREYNDYVYYTYNSGLMGQSQLMRKKKDSEETEIILDPNSWSTDGTVALTSYSISKNGSYICYGKSTSGSDWISLFCMDLSTLQHFTPTIEYCKFTSITWTHDECGVFYQQYPKPSTTDLGTETDQSLNPSLKYFNWKTNESSLIYKDFNHPTWMFSTQMSYDGTICFIYVSRDCEPKNLLFYFSVDSIKDPTIHILIDTWVAEYSYVYHSGSSFLLKTNCNAPQYKLILFTNVKSTDVNCSYPGPGFAVLQDAFVVKDKLCIEWLVDVVSKFTIHSLQGQFLNEISLIKNSSIAQLSSKYHLNTVYLLVNGFTSPGSLFELDVCTFAVTLVRETKVHLDLSQLETTMEWLTASDSVKVPVFITKLKNVAKSESPVYLYGYGGFNISLNPYFSMIAASFMLKCKGTYAVACIRGGGEFGEEWHEAGIKLNKKRGFMDFIEMAKLLKQQHPVLFSHGGSNGGLLTAACAQMAPQCFDAVISDVGVMDMLRYHKFTIGHAWISDYGDPEDIVMTDYLKSYSPCHNPTKSLPYLLCCTSDHDDRVVPHHSYKFVANQSCSDKIYLRVTRKAGHGAGKPIKMTIKEWADKYSFICQVLQIKWE